MAKQFGSQLDLQKIPVLNIVMQQAASGSAPASPVNGQLWYDTTNNKAKVYENGSWLDIYSTAAAGGPAGGDLSGTYPNPTIGTGKVTGAKLAADAVDNINILNNAITPNKVDPTYRDGTAGNLSLRTLGTGAQQAAAGDHGHALNSAGLTGVLPTSKGGLGVASGVIQGGVMYGVDSLQAQTTLAGTSGQFLKSNGSAAPSWTNHDAAAHSTISRSAFAVPTADISWGGFKITNLADPATGTDAANKQYVDAQAQGLDAKPSVRCATTASISGGTQPGGPQTIDGIAVADGNRVLVKDQASAQYNGIWSVVTGGSWNRVLDMDAWTEVPGAFTFVEEGTTNADTGWVCSANTGGTLNTTAITWVQFSAAGQIQAGAGMTKTGTTLDVIARTNGGIDVAADDIAVKVTAGNGILTGASGVYLVLKAVPGLELDTAGLAVQIKASGGLNKDANGVYVDTNGITNAMLADGAVNLATADVTGTLPLTKGGTGGTDAATARTALGTTGKFSGTFGALTAGVEATLTHNLGTKDIVPSFRLVATDRGVEFDWRAVDTNTIGITADVAYSASTVRCVVVG